MYNCVLMLQNSLRNECNSFEAAKYYEMVMELEKSDVMYPSFIWNILSAFIYTS